jgi:hypothetical protein
LFFIFNDFLSLKKRHAAFQTELFSLPVDRHQGAIVGVRLENGKYPMLSLFFEQA